MCGLTGFLSKKSLTDVSLQSQAARMNDVIAHRGPDGDGFWVDASAGVSLAHRRLAIVDLSANGDQPMISSCGNLVMVYNGEVYNRRELADELKNIQLKGTSDSEVILESFSQQGIRKTVEKLIGMFAIVVWNRRERTLTLIRDRLGIKPLYWAKTEGSFLFGSELKALKQHPDFPDRISNSALTNYMRTGHMSAPDTIYRDVYQLEPGHILTTQIGSDPKQEKFWSLDNVVEQSAQNPFAGSEQEAVTELENLLTDAVTRRMVSDVPLGAFLSGGIDSSCVAALMQRSSSTPIKTFTIGFDAENYNEAEHAAAVAKHIGTDHTELYLNAQETMDIIPKLTSMHDEPFADASQIPTFLLSRLTRDHVTVALSGDGGDELFTGYSRYFDTYKYRHLTIQPNALRKLEATILDSLSEKRLEKINGLLPSALRRNMVGDKLKLLKIILRDGNFTSLYQSALSLNKNPCDLLVTGVDEEKKPWATARNIKFKNEYEIMQYIDTLDYLPNDILTKVDRASMAASLEARVPLLDHRVVEFAWRLPQNCKVQKDQGKRILRRVLYRHVPPELIDRPKMGFGVPIGDWLKGPLNDWAEDLLSVSSLTETQILNPVPIRKMWTEHLQGKRDWQYGLWTILSLQAWARQTTYSVE